jgi:hypothetical protein
MLIPILHPLWKQGSITLFSDANIMVSLESYQLLFSTHTTFIRRLEMTQCGIYQLNYMASLPREQSTFILISSKSEWNFIFNSTKKHIHHD